MSFGEAIRRAIKGTIPRFVIVKKGVYDVVLGYKELISALDAGWKWVSVDL